MSAPQRGILLVYATLVSLFSTTGPCLAKKKHKHPVRMAVSTRNISWVDPVSAKAVAATVMKEIGRRTGYTFRLDMFKRIDQFVDRLAAGEYNVGIASALEYVQLAPQLQVTPIGREFRFNRTSYKILLLVRKGSKLKKISDLRGKKLSLSDDDPLNKVYLRVLLARNGIKEAPAGFFSEVEVKVKPKAAVLDLFLQEADACLATNTIFNSMSQLNPQLKRKLQPIHYSESISNGVVFVRNDMPKKTARDFTKVLLTLHQTEKGKQLLKIFRTPKMASVTDKDYASARKIWKEYQELTQKQ
jgi:ABC-type phosphate/phosphonate transport system substrate-binding protein